MAAAYEPALKLLSFKNRDDPLIEIIAKKIIEITLSGESDPPLHPRLERTWSADAINASNGVYETLQYCSK